MQVTVLSVITLFIGNGIWALFPYSSAVISSANCAYASEDFSAWLGGVEVLIGVGDVCGLRSRAVVVKISVINKAEKISLCCKLFIWY